MTNLIIINRASASNNKIEGFLRYLQLSGDLEEDEFQK